jgi:WD40 repeat protein
MAFRPDGGELAYSDYSGEVFILTVETCAVRLVFKAFPFWAGSLAWSPDGRRLAVGQGAFVEKPVAPGRTIRSEPTPLKIFDTATGDLVWRSGEDIGDGSCSSLNFNADGTLLASNCDGYARIWRTADMSVVSQAMLIPLGRGAQRILFSPTGRQVAITGLDELRIYEILP